MFAHARSCTYSADILLCRCRADPFDSNVITPGTPFMGRLALFLRWFVRYKLETDEGWRGLKVERPYKAPVTQVLTAMSHEICIWFLSRLKFSDTHTHTHTHTHTLSLSVCVCVLTGCYFGCIGSGRRRAQGSRLHPKTASVPGLQSKHKVGFFPIDLCPLVAPTSCINSHGLSGG